LVNTNEYCFSPVIKLLHKHPLSPPRCSSIIGRSSGTKKILKQRNLPSTLFHHKERCNNNNQSHQNYQMKIGGRRSFFKGIITSTTVGGGALLVPKKANAQYVRFPAKNLMNTYHLLRAGESLLEEEGIWLTNPLSLTNRESALSNLGSKQMLQGCQMLKEKNIVPTIIKYSLASNAMESADMLSRELKIGRDRVVPEFTFMDPRAIGKWDMSKFDETQSAIWALDTDEAGEYGRDGRPPPNDDGTPNEVLADQTVRLQQLLSVLETIYSGETIVLVFPDGASPALLTCLIGGIPLERVHELEYKPGEIRLNVNYGNARDQIKSESSEEYIKQVEKGREQLKQLRENPDDILDVRDKEFEKEMVLEKERLEEEQKQLIIQQKKTEEIEAKKKKQLEESARQREEEKKVKKAQLQEAERQREEEKKLKKAQLQEIAQQREEEKKVKEKQLEESARQREEEQRVKMSQLEESARQREAVKKVKKAQLEEIVRQREEAKKVKKLQFEQLEEVARQKKEEKRVKLLQLDRQRGEENNTIKKVVQVTKEEEVQKETGDVNLVVGGLSLIGAAGGAYFFFNEEEDSESHSRDDKIRVVDNGEKVLEFSEELTTAEEATLGDEDEVVRLAEEQLRTALKEEATTAMEESKHLKDEKLRIRVEEEARIIAEKEEAQRLKEEESRLKAEKEEAQRLKAEEESRIKAEEAARIMAEKEEAKRLKEQEEARLKAEEVEAKRLKAVEEARVKAEEEEKAKEVEAQRLKAEEEARLKVEEEEQEARLKAKEIEAQQLKAEEVTLMTKKEETKVTPNLAISDEYEDDGGAAWIGSLAEIMNEDD